MHAELQSILHHVIAAVLGRLIGLERQSANRPAGLRTYILVTMASALVTSLSRVAFQTSTFSQADPIRLIAALLTGTGFIGAGVIIHRSDHHVEGITTAAGLWMTTAIGIAVGLGYYLIASVSALFTLFTLFILVKMEKD